LWQLRWHAVVPPLQQVSAAVQQLQTTVHSASRGQAAHNVVKQQQVISLLTAGVCTAAYQITASGSIYCSELALCAV
jgi:hypothetical protein